MQSTLVLHKIHTQHKTCMYFRENFHVWQYFFRSMLVIKCPSKIPLDNKKICINCKIFTSAGNVRKTLWVHSTGCSFPGFLSVPVTHCTGVLYHFFQVSMAARTLTEANLSFTRPRCPRLDFDWKIHLIKKTAL